ncbi:hypothetical protein BJ912DRAFT_700684 [Pholiota molesta]|nr:hypothetical protein BJ912DRAFT_700684 [Pholiota molesta]
MSAVTCLEFFLALISDLQIWGAEMAIGPWGEVSGTKLCDDSRVVCRLSAIESYIVRTPQASCGMMMLAVPERSISYAVSFADGRTTSKGPTLTNGTACAIRRPSFQSPSSRDS